MAYGSEGVQTRDEGVDLGYARVLDFVGAGVSAVNVGGVCTITINGGGGGSGVDVADEGVLLGTATILDFTGAGVTVSFLAGVATVNIPGITTPVAVADGGTGAATEQAAAQNLAVPFILQKSGVAVSAPADAAENILATINVPALSANDCIEMFFVFSTNSNANAKTIRIRFSGGAGTILFSGSVVNQLSARGVFRLWNRNATNSQISNALVITGSGVLNQAPTASAIDTSVATTIEITAQKGVAGDTMTLEGYEVKLLSDGT